MRLTVSVPDELGEAAIAQAAKERRSLSNLVALFIERGVHGGYVERPVVEHGGKEFHGPDPKVK